MGGEKMSPWKHRSVASSNSSKATMSACDSGAQATCWGQLPVLLAPVGVVFESRQTIRSVLPSKPPPLTKREAKVVGSGSRWSVAVAAT